MIDWLIIAAMATLILEIGQKMNYARVGKRVRDIEDLEWTITYLTLTLALLLLGIFL